MAIDLPPRSSNTQSTLREADVEWTAELDTLQLSGAHHVFRVDRSLMSTCILAYAACVAFTYLPLLVVVALSNQPFWQITSDNSPNGAPAVALPFLRDWNITFTFLVSFPVLFLLLLSDQYTLRLSLARVRASGVIEIADAKMLELEAKWSKIFRRANLYSQLLGLIFGAFLSWFTFRAYAGSHAKFWANTGDEVTAVGVVYIYCIALLYALIVVYVTRCVCIAFFLRSLVTQASLRMLPFHPDGCGGLQPVGRLGLRNQYTLSILGMNIAVFAAVTISYLGHARAEAELIAIAVVAYLVLGPTVFLGPLLPFREGMYRTKAQLMGEVAERLRTEFRRVRLELSTASPSKDDIETLERLKKLAEMINELPVWPFDARTLRRFGSVYMAPLALTLASKAAVGLLPHLTKLL